MWWRGGKGPAAMKSYIGGKYSAISSCKSLCSDKNPCVAVKKLSCLNMNIVLSFCSLGNDSLLWGEVENVSPSTTTPCPELRPPKSLTWSSRKKSRPLPPPAPLEPPLWRTSGCTLWKETRGGRKMGWLSPCDVYSNSGNEAAASDTVALWQMIQCRSWWGSPQWLCEPPHTLQLLINKNIFSPWQNDLHSLI